MALTAMSEPARLVVHRLLAGVLVVWGAATVTFFAVHLVPGDIVDALLGPNAAATPRLRQEVIEQHGLDRPLLVQYGAMLLAMLGGDLGRSAQLNEPIGGLLAGQFAATFELAVSAMVTALALAFLAAFGTAGRGRVARAIASVTELLAVSIPSFWLGIVLLSVFSFQLGIAPSVGATGPAGLVLPTLALALPLAGVLAQVIRQELAAVDLRPFALTARARGLSERAVLLRHTLPNAVLPAATTAGWAFGALFSGVVLVENIFGRPGLGRILVDAVSTRDLSVVTAMVLLSAVAFVLINIVVDLIHLVVDPRLRNGVLR